MRRRNDLSFDRNSSFRYFAVVNRNLNLNLLLNALLLRRVAVGF
jgi:hypothetical protein